MKSPWTRTLTSIASSSSSLVLTVVLCRLGLEVAVEGEDDVLGVGVELLRRAGRRGRRSSSGWRACAGMSNASPISSGECWSTLRSAQKKWPVGTQSARSARAPRRRAPRRSRSSETRLGARPDSLRIPRRRPHSPSQYSGGPSHMFVSKAAVVGGGTMGGEIAQAIATADIPVVVKDIDQKFVDAAVEKARAITDGKLTRLVEKEKLTQEQADARLDEVLGTDRRHDHLRGVRRRRLRDRGGARRRWRSSRPSSASSTPSRPATRSSPPTPPRSRSPRSGKRRCGPRRSSASTSSTRPR